MRVANGLFAQLDETFGLEERVSVSFETARIPGEINQQPAEDLFGVGPRGLFGDLQAANGRQMHTVLFGQVEGSVRPIAVKKFSVVTDWLACLRCITEIVADRCPRLRERNDRFVDIFPHRHDLGHLGHPVSRPEPFATHDEAISGDEVLEAILEGAWRDGSCQGAHNLRRRHAVGVAPHGFFDR
jgi:hypothetical protein